MTSRASRTTGRPAHHLGRDILKYIPSVLLPRLTGLITLPIVTRLFPPEYYGAYALVLANVAVLNSATLTGVASSLLRFLPEHEGDPEREGRLVSTLVTLTLGICAVTALIGGVALAVASQTLNPLYTRLMLLGFVLYAANGVFNLVAQVLRSTRRAGMYSAIQLVSGYGGVAFGLVLVLVFKVGIQGLLFGMILAAVLGIVLGWRSALSGRRVRLAGFSPQVMRHVAHYAFFVSIGNAAYWLLSYSDRWILQFFHGAQSVGLYAVGYDLTGRTTMLFVSTFALALQPLSIATWENSGRLATERFLTASTRLYLLVMLPATVGLILLARPLVGLLAGPSYFRGSLVVPYVACAMLVFGLLDIAGRALTLSKRPDLEARNFFIAGITNVACNLVFIPRFGIVAAACSTLLGYVVLFALHVVAAREFATWRFPWRSAARIAVGCAVMGAVVLGLGEVTEAWNRGARLVLLTCAGAATYALAVLALREVSLGQLREMLSPSAGAPEPEGRA